MTKPKTYGEFANQMQDVHIDERVRDREISEDAWRILNLHKEIPEDVKEHFDIQDVRYLMWTSTMTITLRLLPQQKIATNQLSYLPLLVTDSKQLLIA